MTLIYTSKEQLTEIIDKVIDQKISEYLKTIQQTGQKRDIYNIEEAAEILCMSPHTLRQKTRQGKIKTVLSDVRGYRYHIDDINEYIFNLSKKSINK